MNHEFGEQLIPASMGGKSFAYWYAWTITGVGETVSKESVLKPSMLDENNKAHLEAVYKNYEFDVSAIYIYGKYKNIAKYAKNYSDLSVFEGVESNVIHNTEAEWAPELRNTDAYKVAGHKFIGMAYTKNCELEKDVEKTIVPFDNTILYAVWKPHQYSINYYLDDNNTNESKLLFVQNMVAENVDDLVLPETIMNESWYSAFKCWKICSNRGEGIGVNTEMKKLITNGAPGGKPVCDLVSEENGSINLYAEYKTTPKAEFLSSRAADWAMLEIVNNAGKTIEENKMPVLTNYRMIIFKDINTEPQNSLNYSAKYIVRKYIPTAISSSSTTNLGQQNFTFIYGEDTLTEKAFKVTKSLYVKPAFLSSEISLLSDDFNPVFRYNSKIDLTDLSVIEIAKGSNDSILSSTIYDWSSMIYDPVSALYSKLTENFNLNMTFRSNIDSDITKSFSIPITIWSKIVGLSVIEPEIPPTLPAKLEFRPDKYFTGLSVAGIYENGNLTEIANYTHLSVTNLPISSEILMVSPKILKVCSCYIDSIYPEVSCIYPVTVEECKYTATITKYPAKTIYSPTDIDIKLNGISGVIQYGTETIPMAATVNLPDDTYFTTYFPSLTEGKNNIPLYATYNFNNSGNNGTFPNWDPFTDGNMAFAETYLPIYVQSDNVILKMKLDCGNEKINVDFSRLIPTDSYRNTDFTIEFDSASDAESAVLSTNQILERKLDGEVEVTVVTDYNIFDDSDTNIPLKCKVNSNWQTGNNDFANYVTEYECHTGILENFAAGCRNMRQNITVKFGVGISIGDNAFRNTSCLTSLTFENENGSEEEPEYLNIGNNAFLSSASFQTFIGAGYSTRDTVNDCVFPIKSNGIVKIGENAFSYTKSLTAVSFANTGNTTAIGNKAFNNANKLQNISLLNSNISELGNETFKNCTSLQSIFFGGSNSKLRKIGSKTFENCNKLEFIILPELLDSIGSSAFMNCDMLTEIHIPAKTSTIGNLAFKNCDRLTAVYSRKIK